MSSAGAHITAPRLAVLAALAEVREVMGDTTPNRLVANITGHLKNDVSASVLGRALEYWRNVDKTLGDRVAGNVNGG